MGQITVPGDDPARPDHGDGGMVCAPVVDAAEDVGECF
jgi:hypothetical protein